MGTEAQNTATFDFDGATNLDESSAGTGDPLTFAVTALPQKVFFRVRVGDSKWGNGNGVGPCMRAGRAG